MNDIVWVSGVTAGFTTIVINVLDKYLDYLKNKNYTRESKKLDLLGRLMGTAELLAFYQSQFRSTHLACNYYEYCWNQDNDSKAFIEKQMEYEKQRMDQLFVEYAKARKSYIDCLFQIKKVFPTNDEIDTLISLLINPILPVVNDEFSDYSISLLKKAQEEISLICDKQIVEPSRELYNKLSDSWSY